jgi:hypothetical protein
MHRLEEYHWRGLDPLNLGAIVGVVGLWAILIMMAGVLATWQMMLLIAFVALVTAWVLSRFIARKPSGAWITHTHLNIYCGAKHWTFPLSGIRAVGARSAPFFARPPHLELTGGRRVHLPLTCLPPAPELRRWFKEHPIRVDAKITLS